MGMNKSIFEQNPVSIKISRSKFDESYETTTTFNAGKLIPVYNQDVQPGDTWKLDFSAVTRMTTPIAPVMDNAFMDVYFFFVPNKLVLSRQSMSPSVNDSNHSWTAIMGAQDNLLNMPFPAEGVSIPTINFGIQGTASDSNFDKHSLSDYLGLPDVDVVTAGKRNIECLEALSYYSVYNHYFRDQNNTNPVTYSINGGHVFLSGGPYDYQNLPNIGYGEGASYLGSGADSIMPVCRTANYFSSCLPWPQRNSTAVNLPIGDIAPLKAVASDTGAELSSLYGAKVRFPGAWSGIHNLVGNFGDGGAVGDVHVGLEASSDHLGSPILGTNVVADLSSAQSASVNAIRYAFALQRYYEKLARGGNSLADLTKTMFGVTPSWAHSDRPEYLGGKRIPIEVSQVNATAGTTAEGQQIKLGSTGAYSLTFDRGSMFTKSFDTWGTIIGVACVRTDESFHQGLDRRFSRKTKFDLYNPTFASIGEQPVYGREIFFDGTEGDDSVFGYQEAWAEYRYRNNVKSGYCRPGQEQAYWNYCNHFSTRPSLKGYIDGTTIKDNIDRTLQVPSGTAGFQFMANFAWHVSAVRPMPTYSVPGLIDHN